MTSVREDHHREAGAADEAREAEEVVPPTGEDPVARAGSEVIGGPLGRFAAVGRGGWWNPLRVIVLVAIGMFALGMVQKLPCYDSGWFFGANAQYSHACYSDIPHLYYGRGFADDLVPYFDHIPDKVSGGMGYLEYPVLTGVFMEVASWLTPHGGTIQHREQIYWLVNAGMLMACTAVIAVCVARTNRRRPWDALLVALAPAFALNATINWDLFAVALAAAGMMLWSRSRPLAAGILIGLATAAKLYPVFLLWPLLVLALRAGKLKAWGAAFGGAAGSWIVVNLPVAFLAWDGWSRFYGFSQERGVDYGSFWLIITQQTGISLDRTVVNFYAAVLFALLAVGIGLLALWAPRRPRFAQLAFLVVAAFILTNKVYSPQYVLWLVPLAALARPRWRDFLIWQAAEVMYFLGIWFYLAYTTGGGNKGLPMDGYHLAIAVHLLGTLYLCAVVVRDVLFPERDPVRRDGSDDPSGGVLDEAEDKVTLGRSGHHARHAVPFAGPEGAYGPGRPVQQPVQWGVDPNPPA
ncbi:glycosyltransferase family 87 protein [Streptomyces sp. MI02-7b]|uniref:glycosyltransferase family 87 protein n=1 Tax=Streptomyces sp. MI02-7b TaxID=462941 RepID=UPI0029B9D4AA|nr:glycosyltransferase 87 family protein [Streptomyces sp. MI02-7b]MDX3076385.1 glycosyltransferase 87 family protein [Streptomyces sp. MI02-7b]